MPETPTQGSPTVQNEADIQISKKRRRCFHRCMSGIERGGKLRFLTLTSSYDSPGDLQKSWRVLYYRLRRRGLIAGYIKVPEASKSGLKHLHVLFRGEYIDQAMISAWWDEIHHAKIVDIRAVWRGHNRKSVAAYMAKYMSKANSFRYSWSWGWVWKGFVGDWEHLKKAFWHYNRLGEPLPFKVLLNAWRSWLHSGIPPDVFGFELA